MKGKNKLVPRLLGITKESVMRVDEKTKEVIQEWSLTNIKRWAASPKSFTLVSFSERLFFMLFHSGNQWKRKKSSSLGQYCINNKKELNIFVYNNCIFLFCYYKYFFLLKWNILFIYQTLYLTLAACLKKGPPDLERFYQICQHDNFISAIYMYTCSLDE